MHIALIMDGNRRWAKDNGVTSFQGHKKGIENAKELIKESMELGIDVVSLYCFSTENWKRSKDEVSYLMRLFTDYVKKYFEELSQYNVVFRHIGRKDRIPSFLRKVLNHVEEETKDNKGMVVQFAIDYGGRDEIVRAIDLFARENDGLQKEEDFEKYLDTEKYSNVDLLIRTSGEQRLSNFLLWQIAYAEFIFVPCHFPAFSKDLFRNVIEDFKLRDRRFGS